MGCKTCKDKKGSKQNNQNNMNEKDYVVPGNDTINLIPEEIANGDFSGNFMFKVVAFIVMTLAIPLIIIVLMGQMFLTFFMPKSLPKVSKKVKGFFMGGIKGYAKFKHDKEVRKRKRQFEKTMGYEEGSELIDIEDYTDINVHEDNNEKE
jgi:hypothetical protein